MKQIKHILRESINLVVENQRLINGILDKISEKGIKSLTFAEKSYLDANSVGNKEQERKFEKDVENSLFGVKKGTKIRLQFPNSLRFEFDYDHSSPSAENVLYYGNVIVGDQKYHGAVLSDPDGKMIDFEFRNLATDNNMRDEFEGKEYELDKFFWYLADKLYTIESGENVD